MTIAIFDSGAGGLTVLKTFLKSACLSNFIYFADYQHLPYGEKSPEAVSQYVLDSVDFLAKKNIDALVIACNTATSLAIGELRNQKKFNFPIFGMEPAVKLAVDTVAKAKKAKKAEILLTATKITANSQQLAQLKKRFSKKANFETLVLGELVNFVENNVFNQEKIEIYLKSQIKYQKKFDAIVLGCTHFSFYEQNFKNMFPQSLVVDGNLGTVNHVIKKLNIDCLKEQKKQQITFYFSQKKDSQLEKKYQSLLKRLD
jgi:glutamate racemase